MPWVSKVCDAVEEWAAANAMSVTSVAQKLGVEYSALIEPVASKRASGLASAAADIVMVVLPRSAWVELGPVLRRYGCAGFDPMPVVNGL